MISAVYGATVAMHPAGPVSGIVHLETGQTTVEPGAHTGRVFDGDQEPCWANFSVREVPIAGRIRSIGRIIRIIAATGATRVHHDDAQLWV